MKSHTIEDCISHLKSQTPAEPVPKVFDFLKDFEETGLDPLLGTFSNLLQRDTIPHVLNFLRTFKILDVSDYERITNKCVNQTTDEEIMAMVNILNTKGPHAFWFFVHAMERVHKQFFTQIHGKLVCCVCKVVAQNYDLVHEKEVEQEFVDGASTEASFQCPRQREALSDLLGRVEQLRVSFSSLENGITDIVERINPLPNIMGNLSQRFRNEIKDVMTHPEAHGEIGSHTNVNVIKRLKMKCAQLRRQLESSFRSNSREVQVIVDGHEMKSDALKEVVCKAQKPSEDGTSDGKELLPCHTYEDAWIVFEDRCFERLGQFNPFTAIQRSLGDVLLYGQRHKGKVCCAIGISICITIVGSYLIGYSEWTEGPRTVFA